MKRKCLTIMVLFSMILGLCGCQKDVLKRTQKMDGSVKIGKVTQHVFSDETVDEPIDENKNNTPIIHEESKDFIYVNYEPKVVNNQSTYTGLPSLSAVQFKVNDPDNSRGLSTESISFSFGAAKNGQPHSITINNQQQFDLYQSNALAWDNKSQAKILYLTFDCGYEYQNLTSVMLDTLKEKNISAAFFCTQSYLESSPEVVARMIREGHIVGNHTVNHPSNSATLTRSQLAQEILGVHNYLRVNFGYDSKYFRFPTGAYSQNALDLVDSVGYRSIFWSIAHADWDPEDQPGIDVSFDTITSRLHPGAVILLHTTSPDNAQILGDFIDYALKEGYEFRTLDQYPYWK